MRNAVPASFDANKYRDGDVRRSDTRDGPGAELTGASTLTGDPVSNKKEENLVEIEGIMLETHNGKARYVVLAFGGYLGMGDILFSVPWDALSLDTESNHFILDLEKGRLNDALGFDLDLDLDQDNPG